MALYKYVCTHIEKQVFVKKNKCKLNSYWAKCTCLLYCRDGGHSIEIVLYDNDVEL